MANTLQVDGLARIIALVLREVVNRVKLGRHHTRRRSRGEVQSRVVRRRDRDRDRDRDSFGALELEFHHTLKIIT